MEIIGYFASILIGITLGLIGGGGSTLAVPLLVYLFAVDAVMATTYSLFIVGSSSLVGSYFYFTKKLVNLRTAIVFGVPSIFAIYITRVYILPAIPDQILQIKSFIVTKGMFLMLLFAFLMLISAYGMLRKTKQQEEEEEVSHSYNYPLVLIQGILVGVLTGLVGAGGGFLIVPALVHFMNMPMKKAIGTSLVIIAINSLSGFAFSLSQFTMQWSLILTITVIAIVGILIGSWIAQKIDGKKLKPAFGWFIVLMGIYIILKETLF